MFPTWLLLPTFKYAEKTIFESPSYVNVPDKLDPVHENDERCVMLQFVQELNQHFMIELAAEVCVDREAGVEEEEGEHDVLRGKRVIVVGASHGAHIAMAMEDIGGYWCHCHRPIVPWLEDNTGKRQQHEPATDVSARRKIRWRDANTVPATGQQLLPGV
jgi:hypothetical protein